MGGGVEGMVEVTGVVGYGAGAHHLRYRSTVPQKPRMGTWPVPSGRRHITLELPAELVTYLDQQAARRTCSRSSYLRQLIIDDMAAVAALAAGG